MDDLHDVRMVVQHLGIGPAYRVVVYGDDWKPTHADFENEEALLRALHAALPDFDTFLLCLDQPLQSSCEILFAGSLEMSRRQAQLLRCS